MRVAITGAYGFLGWHTTCRLRVHGVDVVRLGRRDVENPTALREVLSSADSIVHIAGVNRGSDAEVERGNVEIAEAISTEIGDSGRPVDFAYANSIHAGTDSPYGRGKAHAAVLLERTVQSVGGTFADVLLPNLFGEHGRPQYNSFVATFVDDVLHGRTPEVRDDRSIPLLHVQDAAQALWSALGTHGRQAVEGQNRTLTEVRDQLLGIHRMYATRGEIPPLVTRFDVNLFNTYRAAAFPSMWPIHPVVRADDRGELLETVRMHGGTGQGFVSTTRPGRIRGNHYHLHKVERFTVIQGEAQISLRRLLDHEVVTFQLSGTRPSFIDMPTLWVHNIQNVGEKDLITVFWSDQLLDQDNPDQYPEEVSLS